MHANVKQPINKKYVSAKTDKPKAEKYDGLVISSGGYRGICVCGSLAVINMHGHLDSIKRYAGCSIGAIIVTLLAVGWKPIELFRRAIKIKVFTGISSIDVEGLKKNFGLLSSEPLLHELNDLILAKRSKIPTLLDMHNEGIYIAYSISDRRQKSGYKVDYLSDPSMPISIGAIMSSNVPGVFRPMDYEGMKVLDGALINPFPVNYLDNGKDKILGIALYTDTGVNDTSAMGYISGTIMMPIEELQRLISARASKYVDILEHSVADLDLLNNSNAYDLKMEMFFHGIRDGKLFSKALKKRAKAERKKAEKDKTERKRMIPELVKVVVKEIPDNVIQKCFVSQELDLLCEAVSISKNNNAGNNDRSDEGESAIERNFKVLSTEKQTRIINFCREILKKEIASQKSDATSSIRVHPVNKVPYYTKTKPTKSKSKKPNPDKIKTNKAKKTKNVETDKPDSSKQNSLRSEDAHRPGKIHDSDNRYRRSDPIRVRTNYSQKIYDTLPPELKSMAKIVVDSMSAQQVDKTITGINIVFEGLSLLGINLLEGAFITHVVRDSSGSSYNSKDKMPDHSSSSSYSSKSKMPEHNLRKEAPRVEILPDDSDDKPKAKNFKGIRADAKRKAETLAQYVAEAEADRLAFEERERNREKTKTDDID